MTTNHSQPAANTMVDRGQPRLDNLRRSGQDFADDVAVDVGQAEVAALEAVGQLGVVEAQQVQDRGLQVVDVDAVLDGVEAELVGLADGRGRGLTPPPASHMV